LAICATAFKILTLKARKWLIFSPTLVWRPRSIGRNPLEFLDETYPAKTRGMGLPHGKNFIILSSIVFSRPCYNGRAIGTVLRPSVVCRRRLYGMYCG